MESLACRTSLALAEAGLLPSDCQWPPSGAACPADGDLLPLLMQAWGEVCNAAAEKPVCSRAARRVRWLARQHDAGARLTLGAPGCGGRPVERWLGMRLYWWPCGVPDGCRIGLASSRLGQALELRCCWFAALRAACRHIQSRPCLLLTAASTTTSPFVERCAELFDLRWLRVEVAEDVAPSFAKWGRRIRAGDPPTAASSVLLSPPLGPVPDGNLSRTPCRDRAAVVLSDRWLALHVRRGGSLHGLVRAALEDSSWPVGSLAIALGPRLIAPELARQLRELGAVGWAVPQRTRLRAAQDATPVFCSPAAGACLVDLPSAQGWPFLTHCTRRRDGPWPSQSRQDYYDDLILGRAGADHSPLAALCRIVRQERLIAAAGGVRGAAPVVSFTAVPLADLPPLNVYRAHRGRWDFEPFGICIRQSWLEGRGARLVVYGDDRIWATLQPDERPYFQVRRTRSRSVDWSVEREWRCVGDVDLRSLPDDAGLLFAPTESAARQLGRISRWPVTVLSQPSPSAIASSPP